MKHRRFGVLRVQLLMGSALSLRAAAPSAVSAEVFPVIDLHVDVPLQVHWRKRPLPLLAGQVNLDTMKAGHVVGLVLPAYVPDKRKPDPRDLDAVFDAIDSIRDSEPFKAGSVKTWRSMEGARSIGDDASRIDPLLARGVRLVGLVHMADNPLGGSSTGRERGGLTDVGRAMAKRVLEKGALLDASHLSDKAFDDVLALSIESHVPLVASHSNARSLRDHPRNLTDGQLRAIASTGGVVGLNLHVPYLRDREPEMNDIVKMVSHMIAVAGEDHVAIGSDFDGEIRAPKVMRDASAFPELASALLAAGHPPERIRKVFADNARRVLDGKRE